MKIHVYDSENRDVTGENDWFVDTEGILYIVTDGSGGMEKAGKGYRWVMLFHVYDMEGRDVTEDKDWFINMKGNLYFMTDDVDSPMQEAGDGYWYGD